MRSKNDIGKKKGIRSYLIFFLGLSLLSPGLTACWPNQRIVESGNENPPANVFRQDVKPAVSTFEEDIEAMRTADFYFIYVFRRNDNAPFDAGDKQFLSANIPAEINRRQLSDEGRALIAGSNFKIPDEMFAKLKERFDFEDFSRPESGIMANSSPNTK